MNKNRDRKKIIVPTNEALATVKNYSGRYLIW